MLTVLAILLDKSLVLVQLTADFGYIAALTQRIRQDGFNRQLT
jgi:hypothetical protein